MIDKRALNNENLYKKLELETNKILKEIDFEKNAIEHKEIIEQIGHCYLSVGNTIEVMKENDCMCIGLKV